MAIGRVAARCLRQTGKHAALGQGQLIDILVKIVLRSSLHAVCTVAKENLVEIKVENFFLGQAFFHAVGKDRLLELALELALRRQQQGFGDLLGYGAAALDYTAGLDVLESGSNDRGNVDPLVFEEVGILGGNKSLDQLLRHARNGDNDATLVIEFRDHRAVIT